MLVGVDSVTLTTVALSGINLTSSIYISHDSWGVVGSGKGGVQLLSTHKSSGTAGSLMTLPEGVACLTAERRLCGLELWSAGETGVTWEDGWMLSSSSVKYTGGVGLYGEG